MKNTHFTKIHYNDLNPRQKENYNFQKAASKLADYGFNCIRLSDDWQGADFLAIHINDNVFLKVQLKGSFTIDKKYLGKDIWICFPFGDEWYLYPHDKIVEGLKEYSNFENTSSWKEHGYIFNIHPSKRDFELLKHYKIYD